MIREAVRGMIWFKRGGAEEAVVPDLGVHFVKDPTRVSVPNAGQKSFFRFPRQRAGNCCVWSVSKNTDDLEKGTP